MTNTPETKGQFSDTEIFANEIATIVINAAQDAHSDDIVMGIHMILTTTVRLAKLQMDLADDSDLAADGIIAEINAVRAAPYALSLGASIPIKPSGEVNLSLTVGELKLIKASLSVATNQNRYFGGLNRLQGLKFKVRSAFREIRQ